ncbi:MAG: 30S ribosomal protein S16, partial [Crocinitomicaceae bacterium]|nr:30S ribosomal protein S16 [Crocinitomicaceae bacterium]
MATKIRLQRHGKKGKPFYHMVAADSRAKRDGRFIEKLGTYNPNTNPATVDLNFERTLHWVQVGAEMSDTARALLSYKGILHKNHLLNGVKKGAFTAEQAEEKFSKWLEEKDAKIQTKVDSLSSAATKVEADRMKAETAIKEARAKAIAEKNAPVEEAAPATEAVEAEVTSAEETTEATTEEAPAVEEVKEEAPVVEAAAEETPAVEEAKEEAPVVEAAAEETPAVEE